MTDLLIVSVNIMFIMVVYKSLTIFLDYRTKQRLINEGFIDELSLNKIFRWNRKKYLADMLKLGAFSGAVSFSFFIIYLTLYAFKELLAAGIILIAISLASFISSKWISKIE